MFPTPRSEIFCLGKKDLSDEIVNPSYEDYEITLDKEAMKKYEGLQVEIVEGM